MADAKPPLIYCDRVHPGVAVSDLQVALDFYVGKLGFVQAFTWADPPTFAGINFGDTQIFLQQGRPTPSDTTAIAYFNVKDVDEVFDFHRTNGVDIAQPLADRDYGMRDYAVRDPDGYYLVFGRPRLNVGPPIEIERVDVPVRLEKRLAALLQDLAVHKRMSVSSALEEMILHTNEGVGPHTDHTLAYIRELKTKHGIDYDCHASYRFREL